MPRKLMIGMLGALVVGTVGLAQNASASTPFPVNDAQSFCVNTGHGAAGTCPAGFSPIDWDVCYDNGGGIAPSGSLTCGAGTSDSAIVALTGPITSWQMLSVPIGSRLALPVTYTPAAFGHAAVSPEDLTVATGDVTARTDILCDGTLDILARNNTADAGGGGTAAFNSGKDPDADPPPGGGVGVWPGNGWDPYNFYRDVLSDPNYAYVDQIKPMPFADVSMDVARLVKVWLGGTVGIDLPPEPSPEGVTDPSIQGTPLVLLDTASPYVSGLHVRATMLAGGANPPDNRWLCVDSPQDSVVTDLETLPPQADGGYVRWANIQSAADLVSGQVTRIMIARCLQVGTGIGAGTCPGGANMGDTDGDGVPDSVEMVIGTDPAVGKTDTDSDGSSDFQETFQFTNPGCVIGGVDSFSGCPGQPGAGPGSDSRDTDGDGSWDKQDDLSGLACGVNGGPAVTGVCPVSNNGDLPATGAGSDDNCPAVANPSQLNTDSLFDFTNSPNTPAGVYYRGDSTNPHQDWQGDACDSDADNDGMDNVVEAGFNHTNVAPGCVSAGVPAGCPGAGPAAGTLWCLAQGATAPSGGMTTLATDPLNPDTDSDGGLDGRECQFSSDPIGNGAMSCNPGCVGLNRYPAAGPGADPDGDFLFPAAAELFYRTSHISKGSGPALDDLEQSQMGGPTTPGGTNNYNCPFAVEGACKPIPDGSVGPNDPDSDGDLLNDGWEVKWYDTSPANFDTDGDGCSDGREAADVNGDHKVNSTDISDVGTHSVTGARQPSPPYNNGAGVRRDELATYDVNKDGFINSTDQTLVHKLWGICKFATGVNFAQGSTPIVIGTKP